MDPLIKLGMTVSHDMRLDQRLVAEGLVPSRSRARDLILRGFVSIDGKVCARPAQAVAASARVGLNEEAPRYVSRGAEKLIAALDAFGFDPTGRVALDAGTSTGGFTQVLLERGASRVYAVDVGTAQLHAHIRHDPRVAVMENCDVRAIERETIAEPLQAVVADLSFISLAKALPRVLALAESQAFLVALIKPQFELNPDDIGKGGIVRNERARARAVASVTMFVAESPGWRVHGVIPSPIEGGSGNAEFLLGAVKND